MDSATIPIAQATGIYRCTVAGETWHRQVGEELTPCGCRGAVWELRAEDTLPKNEVIRIFMGKMGIFTNQLPENGLEYNLRGGQHPAYDGKYCVVQTWFVGNEIHMSVERVGELDRMLPIHSVVMLDC